MKNLNIRLFSVISGLLLAIIVPAQDLPILTPDPAVRHGVLPNGLNYYVVANPSVKGCADFALVQKTGFRTDPEADSTKAVSVAKEALAALPRLTSTSPQAWLASHGVTTSAEGFINVSEDATVFRFHDVSLNSGKDVADSTLLILMSIVDRRSVSEDDYLKKWYSPSDQALVVSGDINPDEIISKMHSMSFMVPASQSLPRKEYEWVEGDSSMFVMDVDSAARFASASVTWRLPRAPYEYMNTVQPSIYEKFVNELGYIADRRIRKALHERNIPVADVWWHHTSSAEGSGDEMFAAGVSVGEGNLEEALAALAATFASIDASATTADELAVARNTYVQMLADQVGTVFKSNSEYVDRCVSAFLRNSSLASPAEKLELHISRDVSDETHLELFNTMASALLDGTGRNLTVRCIYPDAAYDQDHLQNVFHKAWSESFDNPSEVHAFYSRAGFTWPGTGPKVKLKSTVPEPMSGGTMYTFSNGFRVVFKKMDTKGKIYWTMAMNGGYSSVESLSEGEGAFVPDYFNTCRIAGLEGEAFRDLLVAEGMTFDVLVGLTGTLFTGTAPDGRIDKVLQTLLAAANERTDDPEAFSAWMHDQQLSLEFTKDTRQARLARIDSIVCPGYKYSWMKSEGKLTPALSAKADGFFSSVSSRMNDGVLIIVSDISETELKKALLAYVGGFRTQVSATRRPSVRYQPISGWLTHTVDGPGESIDVVMSAAMPLTMDNYMTAAIASMILEKSLAADLSETGMYPRVSYNFQLSPQERLSMMVSVETVSPMGYASYIDHTGSIEALSVVRNGLRDLTVTRIPESVLEASKAYLKNYISMKMNTPEYWMDALAKRYLDGKDFTTSYAARIDAVTVDKIMDMLITLNRGTKVEYVVK